MNLFLKLWDMRNAKTIIYILICIISVGFVNHYWNTSTAIWIAFGLLGCYLIGRSYEDVN
jgi:hypothetical protein